MATSSLTGHATRTSGRHTAASFSVGDLVRPSKAYLRSIGPTTKKKDGIVLGKDGRFYIVMWNDMDKPVNVAPASLEMKKRNFKSNPPELRKKWQDFEYEEKSKGLVNKKAAVQAMRKAALEVARKLVAAKERLPKYGEVHREKVGDATIVVRGIFKQKGDSYHVRVLRGDGKASDETKAGNVLWKDDLPFDGGDPKKLVKDAVKAAKSWLKTPAAKKKLASTKVAMSMGKEILYTLVDIKKLYATRKVLSQAGDKQTEQLLRDVMETLINELEPKNRRVQAAINRLNNAVRGSQDPANLRNQIFKVANELGMRLPSAMF